MKRIVKITLKNYKAYLTEHEITLPNGRNLLIYGENGSGKSSLVKAIMHYMHSSVCDTIPFQRNYNLIGEQGSINICFADYDEVTKSVISGTDENYAVYSDSKHSDNGQNFIKDAYVSIGCLDYLSLLKVFLVGEDVREFFDFVILNLLGNFIPIFSGASKSFRDRWNMLNEELLVKSKNRRTRTHLNGLNELNVFKTDLKVTLDKIFVDVNNMLDTYFSHFGLKVNYDLSETKVVYGKKRIDWFIDKGFSLKVNKDGFLIDDYRKVLNEARLSAISICLYLASIKLFPNNELKLLLLDDIFIGIDSSNRLPFLHLLTERFSSYQIILLTYDRNWYNLARTYFQSNASQSWATKEIYNSERVVSGNKYSDPLILEGKTSREKAQSYLYSNDHPDYPASANYYRKCIEELYSSYLPKDFTKNIDLEQIESYKLTKLTNRLYGCLSILQNYIVDLRPILQAVEFVKTMLSPLIHPLSHYSNNDVYRSELIELDNKVTILEEELRKIDLKANCRILLEKGTNLKFIFHGDSPWKFEYYYKLCSNILLYKNNQGSVSLSSGELNIYKMEGIDGNSKYYRNKISKENALYNKMKGLSIENVTKDLFLYIKGQYPMANFNLDANNLSHVMVYNENGKEIKLTNKIQALHLLVL